MNLTDVDDKTIRRSQERKIELGEFTEFYARAFFEDIKKLNIKPATVYPRATKHIPEMVALIKILLDSPPNPCSEYLSRIDSTDSLL